MLWYGELDLLLCPDIDSVQKYGKYVVQGNIFNLQLKPYSSDHKIMVYSAYKMQNLVIRQLEFFLFANWDQAFLKIP